MAERPEKVPRHAHEFARGKAYVHSHPDGLDYHDHVPDEAEELEGSEATVSLATVHYFAREQTEDEDDIPVFGDVGPEEPDEQGYVEHVQPWVDIIADALAERYGLEPNPRERDHPDATITDTPEVLAGVAFRALGPKLTGEARRARKRVSELLTALTVVARAQREHEDEMIEEAGDG